MKKVITYGTYDLLHHGHIKLLERAKALGDYLIVGVTSADFDKNRGKINVQQTLMERIQSVKDTGLADEIIIEEYEGQKIDDIIKYGVDIFTVGSDWEGKFDYLKEYCDVVYLPRTEGVSSSQIRTKSNKLRLGLVGDIENLTKMFNESQFVNGIEVNSICTNSNQIEYAIFKNIKCITNDFEVLLDNVDAVYIISHPIDHYDQIKKALNRKKHVLCESPIVLEQKKCEELFDLARKNNCILMESIKTAYSIAYSRLLLLLKGGAIGKIVSIDSTCTSLKDFEYFENRDLKKEWNSICSWGPTAVLPILQLLGANYKSKSIISMFADETSNFDKFTKINFVYDNAVATLKVGKGVKSEGDLIVSGTKGYAYVPSPWWKTDYFEIRYEDPINNKRYFYQLDGEGIRYELVEFVHAIQNSKYNSNISFSNSSAIAKLIEDFNNKVDVLEIKFEI